MGRTHHFPQRQQLCAGIICTCDFHCRGASVATLCNAQYALARGVQVCHSSLVDIFFVICNPLRRSCILHVWPFSPAAHHRQSWPKLGAHEDARRWSHAKDGWIVGACETLRKHCPKHQTTSSCPWKEDWHTIAGRKWGFLFRFADCSVAICHSSGVTDHLSVHRNFRECHRMCHHQLQCLALPKSNLSSHLSAKGYRASDLCGIFSTCRHYAAFCDYASSIA